MERYKSQIIGAAILILLVAAFFIYQSIVYRTEISEFDLKPTVADAAGIAPESHFILKTTAPLTSQVLEKYMKMVPSVDLSIKKVAAAENTFEIIPKEKLQFDQVYTIEVDKGPLASRDFSWAYQIKAPFQLISSVPGDKRVDIPTNSGIELYFNRENIIDPERSIEITPAAPGTFEVKENTVRFLPTNQLAARTIYTIKIKSGLKAKGTTDVFSDEKIIQFQTGESYTAGQRSSFIGFTRQFAEFKPESDIILGVNSNNVSSVSTAIYRFDSAQDFFDSVTKIQGNAPWARYYSTIGNQLPESKKVFSGNLPVETRDYSSLIRIPQEIATGYYAIMIVSDKVQDLSWFQVNPVASFAAFAGSKSLVWLKDIESERNVTGIPILFNNKQIGQTGPDGIALFDTPSELISTSTDYYSAKERKFFIAKIPAGALIIPTENDSGFVASLSQNESWWDYISLNKNVYLPTDTVRFWAISKPRKGDGISGEEINVTLTNPYWETDQAKIVTYAEAKLKLSDYNALTGELTFSNLKPGIYELTFRKGSETIAKKTLSVSAYIKPAYKITATPNKNSIFAGESVTFNIKAEFFDGTPVSNAALTYSAYGVSDKNTEGNISLNSKGEGSFTVTPEYRSDQTYWPSYLQVQIRPVKAEEGQIQTNSSVFLFGPHINNTISQKQSATGATFTVKTREVVLKNISRVEPYWNTEDYLGAVIPGAITKVDLSEVIYLKDQTGTRYDPINKLNYPIYRYRTEFHPISSQEIVSDQNGIAQFTFSPENKRTYKLILTTFDRTGRAAKDTRYVYGSLDLTNYATEEPYYSLYNSDGNKNYKAGDPVTLLLQTYEGMKPSDGEGKYIFMIVNNGNVEYQIQDTPEYKAVFRDKDIPNIEIWPGWFEGDRFRSGYFQNISFDANERRLNIAVSEDKQTYRPGDNVNLDIKVTDKNNRPVKAEVNLSALDEAVFSIRSGEQDIVNDLYRDIYSQVIIRTSNMPTYGGGAEKGSGGDDESRSNIQEMAIFKSIETNSEGYANVQFKLPDNITSWRLTTQAVTKDLFAGKSVNFIPVTLPFFIDATLNNTYLANDQLILRLRTFGVAANGENVNYSLESPTPGLKKINQSGGSSIEIPLGTLPLGTHELAVRAEANGYSDSLTRALNVIKSYFSKNTSDFYEGQNGLKIKNEALGYTTLSFNSLGRGRLYNELRSMIYQEGIRLDQKATRLMAADLLNDKFGEKNEKPEFQASKYQGWTGGLQLLPYADDDLELSAIAAHLFDDSTFDRAALKNYFYSSLNDKKADISRISRALYGITVSKEPVLTKIESIKNNKALNLTDKVFVALSLDSIGAKEEARSYYKQNIKPSIESRSTYSYVGGLKGDETITTTALVAALTASLEEPESIQLGYYVSQNFPKETLNNFQRLLYINSALTRLDPEEVSFAYKAGSKRESKTLKNGESFELALSSADLSSLELSEVKGRLGITASYEEQSSPMTISKDKNLSLSRSYEVNGAVSREFNEGDLIKVRLLPYISGNALSGSYQIIDYLPSGLRPIDQESGRKYSDDYDSRVTPVEINDQKITFVVDKNVTIPIYYYARVVSKGTYKAEPAILQSLRSQDSATISNEDSIIVR